MGETDGVPPTAPTSANSGSAKRARDRPPMQIYRPPGLRTGSATSDISSPTSPKQSNKLEADRASNASSGSHGSSSTKSSDARPAPPSTTTSTATPKTSVVRRPTQLIKEPKRAVFGAKEAAELSDALRRLDIAKDRQLIDNFLKTNLESDELAESLGLLLPRHAIEEQPKQGQRRVARLAAALVDCPAGPAVHKGLVNCLAQYFDCRNELRRTHSKVWVGFTAFLSDLYAGVGTTFKDGPLVDLIFRLFDYMLKEPVLETLKIEELECLIAILLGVGYDLERNCPDQLSQLKNTIRDAFVVLQEPWARKMILLLMELSASGWQLPNEANEYYFN